MYSEYSYLTDLDQLFKELLTYSFLDFLIFQKIDRNYFMPDIIKSNWKETKNSKYLHLLVFMCFFVIAVSQKSSDIINPAIDTIGTCVSVIIILISLW